jgi:predicted GIY-YIG superfamily endonuclease
MWHVYILKCSDGSYYVGHADNLAERVLRHNSARAAKWTTCRLPVKLVCSESYESEEQAILREQQIKRWSRAKKEALIGGNTEALQILSKKKIAKSSC